MSTQRRILIIGPSNVGDAILAGEVMGSVIQAYAGAQITLVVGQRAVPLFQEHPAIQTLLNADHYAGWARLKLFGYFMRYRPHVTIDLRGTAYPFMLHPLRFWRYLMPIPSTVRHMRDRYLWKLHLQAPQAYFKQGEIVHPALWSSYKDQEQVHQTCERLGLREDTPRVIMCPGSRSHLKRWRAEGFAYVADQLIERLDAQIIFCGEPAEKVIVDEVMQSMTHPAHSVVGLTTIRQLGLFMEAAQVVITNDSAALHLATAVGIPTVAVFGPTPEQHYGPRAPQSCVVRRRLFCSPCGLSLCPFQHECMRFITAEEVYAAAAAILTLAYDDDLDGPHEEEIS